MLRISNDASINCYLNSLADKALELMAAGKNKKAKKLINKINAQTKKIMKTRESFKKIKSRYAKIQKAKNLVQKKELFLNKFKRMGAKSVI
jgi:acylphosphatase